MGAPTISVHSAVQTVLGTHPADRPSAGSADPDGSVLARWRAARPAGVALRFAVYALLAGGVFHLVNQGGANTATACTAVVYALVGLSLNVLVGYTGQLSLGHQGFFGIGAVFAAYAVSEGGLPFGASLVVGVLAGGLLSLLLGLVALRVTGLYFALVTLVIGQTLSESLFAYQPLTNNDNLSAVRPAWLTDKDRYFYLCVALLAVVLFLDTRLTKSKAGRALLALKENERVAEAFGVNVPLYKLLAFTFSGMVAGLAGALGVFLDERFSDNNYTFPLALLFVIMTVVGGTGSRVGVVLGSVFFAVQPALFAAFKSSDLFASLFGRTPGPSTVSFIDNGPGLVGAASLITTLIFFRGGLAQQLRPIIDWMAGHPFDRHAGRSAGGPAAVEGSSVRA